MSTCPNCYVGLCKKHPMQDSGQGLKKKGPSNKAEVISKLYHDLVEKKLQKSRMEEIAESGPSIAEIEQSRSMELARRESEKQRDGGSKRRVDTHTAIGLRPVSESEDSDSSSSSRGSRHRRSSSRRHHHRSSSSRHRDDDRERKEGRKRSRRDDGDDRSGGGGKKSRRREKRGRGEGGDSGSSDDGSRAGSEGRRRRHHSHRHHRSRGEKHNASDVKGSGDEGRHRKDCRRQRSRSNERRKERGDSRSRSRSPSRTGEEHQNGASHRGNDAVGPLSRDGELDGGAHGGRRHMDGAGTVGGGAGAVSAEESRDDAAGAGRLAEGPR